MRSLLLSIAVFSALCQFGFTEVLADPYQVPEDLVGKHYADDEGKCNVVVQGNGITANAVDNNFYGKTASSLLYVVDQGDYASHKFSNYLDIPFHSTFLMTEGGYDVFYVKCLSWARTLPIRVRKLFDRHYGIE